MERVNEAKNGSYFCKSNELFCKKIIWYIPMGKENLVDVRVCDKNNCNVKPTLLLHSLYKMMPLNHRRTTSF